MKSIFWKTLNEKKWTIVIYCVIGVVFLWMFVSIFPSLAKSAVSVSKFIDSLPEDLKKAFGLDPKSLTTFAGYVASKYFSMVWLIMLVGLTVTLGGFSIAGEVEDRTMEITLAQPIRRWKVYISKLVAQIIILAIFVFFTVLSAFPMCWLYSIELNGKGFLLMSVVGFTLGLAILGLTALFSSIFSERGRVVFSITSILLLMYIINIITLLKDLGIVKYFTLFYYFDYVKILVYNEFNHFGLALFLAIFVMSSLAGLIFFQKRDIA